MTEVRLETAGCQLNILSWMSKGNHHRSCFSKAAIHKSIHFHSLQVNESDSIQKSIKSSMLPLVSIGFASLPRNVLIARTPVSRSVTRRIPSG